MKLAGTNKSLKSLKSEVLKLIGEDPF